MKTTSNSISDLRGRVDRLDIRHSGNFALDLSLGVAGINEYAEGKLSLRRRNDGPLDGAIAMIMANAARLADKESA